MQMHRRPSMLSDQQRLALSTTYMALERTTNAETASIAADAPTTLEELVSVPGPPTEEQSKIGLSLESMLHSPQS